MSDQEIQEKATVSGSPFYFHSLLTAKFIGIEKLPMLDAMLVNEFGNFYVEATVFGDFHDAAFAPPFDGIDSVGCLAHAEGRLSNVVQSKLVACRLFDFDQQVQGSQLMRQIEDGVPHQDFIVEVDDVKSDHQVGPQQLLN